MGHWPEAETRSFELFILTAPILNAVSNEYYRKYAIDTAQRENLTIIKKLTAETGNWYVKFCDNGAVFHVTSKAVLPKDCAKELLQHESTGNNFLPRVCTNKITMTKRKFKTFKTQL